MQHSSEHFPAHNTRYGAVARLFHWAVVLLLVGEYSLAWLMPDIHKGTQPAGLIAWHLAIGPLILSVMLLRLGWRSAVGTPEPHPGVAWQELASKLTHGLLYVLLLVLPLLGWINASTRGWSISLLGIPLPALASQGSTVGRDLGEWHSTLAYIVLGLIGLHVSAAFYHHWVRKDGLLARMWG
ncbi:MAG: cytochrome b [Thiomonas sp.]|uniref:Putative Cytochrome B561 n=1 Tax=mine drainage metagenome TaxID=410659 RepID=E6PRV0_9ZZZZ